MKDWSDARKQCRYCGMSPQDCDRLIADSDASAPEGETVEQRAIRQHNAECCAGCSHL